jgi:hypothetical protein
VSVVASIAAAELQYIAAQAYVGKSFSVALVNSPGASFAPTDSLSTVLAGEVSGSGYARQSFTYDSGDVNGYTANGLPLARKAATFTHDGGTGTYTFTHAVVIRGTGGTASLVAVVPLPSGGATMANGSQAVLYFDATTWRVVS